MSASAESLIAASGTVSTRTSPGRRYARRGGREERDPGVPDVPTREADARRSRIAELRPRRARAETFHLEWEQVAHDVVAMLHAEARRDPHHRGLSDLVGELSTQSDAFRTLWAGHDVRRHDTGVKRFNHPVVGELTVAYENLELAADPGLTMLVYTAEPGSRSAEALGLLASWASTPEEETVHGDHEEQPRHRSRAE